MTTQEPDFTVFVCCDDPSHEPRTVSTLVHFTRPVDTATRQTVGSLEWRELVHDDPRQRPALQTPFGEAARLSLPGHALPEGMTYATRYRFDCRDCRTVPVQGDTMEDILNRMRAVGVSFLYLRDLSANL